MQINKWVCKEEKPSLDIPKIPAMKVTVVNLTIVKLDTVEWGVQWFKYTSSIPSIHMVARNHL